MIRIQTKLKQNKYDSLFEATSHPKDSQDDTI